MYFGDRAALVRSFKPEDAEHGASVHIACDCGAEYLDSAHRHVRGSGLTFLWIEQQGFVRIRVTAKAFSKQRESHPGNFEESRNRRI